MRPHRKLFVVILAGYVLLSGPAAHPRHLSPEVPVVIPEGDELGYALATACGAALDAPSCWWRSHSFRKRSGPVPAGVLRVCDHAPPG
ncbi:hypothetical protein AB0F15_13425 [Amycolatopsis sp. NPDC026612]|uniref:hypothetical protein n=1 Tax=Amycolatopsis sp. NPDC026612 TaxID=3155466 RepID=UPI0033E295A0